MKRTFTTIVCCLGLAALLACPLVTMPAQAAKGGAGAVRMTAPRSSSMSAAPTQTPKAAPNSNAKSTTTGQTKQDTTTKTQANTTQPNAQAQTNRSGSMFGGMMRNIGLFAGGMFLGSMLSSMFGMGGMGFMADLLGMVMNVVLLLVIINVIKWLWQKVRRRNTTSRDDEYRRGYEAAMRDQQKRRDPYTIDVKPIDDEKDPFRKH